MFGRLAKIIASNKNTMMCPFKKGGEKKTDSPAGNRTRVFRVTGGDTYHYTTEDDLSSRVRDLNLKPLEQSVTVLNHSHYSRVEM